MTPRNVKTKLGDRSLEDTITWIVVSTLGKKTRKLKPDTPLVSSDIGFDSVSLWELILRIEDTFEIDIPDDDLDPSIFHSIETISTYLRRRLSQGR